MFESMDSHPPDESSTLANLIVLLAMGLQTDSSKKSEERLLSDLADVDDGDGAAVAPFSLEDERSLPIEESSRPCKLLSYPRVS